MNATRNEWNGTWNDELRANEWLQMESAGDGEIVWHVKLLPEQRTCRRQRHRSTERRANNLHSFSGCDFYILAFLLPSLAIAVQKCRRISSRPRDALMPRRLSFIRFVFCAIKSTPPSVIPFHAARGPRWMCFLFNFSFHFVLFVSFGFIRWDFSAAIFVLHFIFRLARPLAVSRSGGMGFYLSIWVDDFNSSSDVDTSQTKQYWIYGTTPAPNNVLPIILYMLEFFFFLTMSWVWVRVRAAVCEAIFIRSSLSLFNSSRANFSFFSTSFFFYSSTVLRSCTRAPVFVLRFGGHRLWWSLSPHRLIGCLIISKHILCWLR